MTEYRVRYRQTQSCEITVQADSADDAQRQVSEDDFTGDNVEWVPDEILVDWELPVIESVEEVGGSESG